MNIKSPNPYGQLSESDLAKFEGALKSRLPDTYREHLLKYNGGEWKPNFFVISEDKGQSVVQSVYGLHNGPEYVQLDKQYQVFKNRIPKDLLAIASDPFGNQICLGIAGSQRNKMYFWDHEVPGRKSTTLIADSFEEFINSLTSDLTTDYLSKVIEDNNLEELRRLLDSGAIRLEDTNQYDRTLLERAAIKGRPEIIAFLFERGAKLRNALAYAEKNAQFFEDHVPVVSLIKRLSEKG